MHGASEGVGEAIIIHSLNLTIMRNELTQIEYIEQYLEGKFSAQERLDFEKQLSAQPELRESVELQRRLMESVEASALRTMVKKVHAQHSGKWWNLSLNTWILSLVIIGGA